MKNRTKLITLLLVLFLILLTVIAIRNMRSSGLPLSLQTSELSSPPSKSVAPTADNGIVIWGKVLDQQKKPLKGIIVSLNGIGSVSNESGEYMIITKNLGRLAITFRQESKETEYTLADDEEPLPTTGSSIQRDFVIKPIEE